MGVSTILILEANSIMGMLTPFFSLHKLGSLTTTVIHLLRLEPIRILYQGG